MAMSFARIGEDAETVVPPMGAVLCLVNTKMSKKTIKNKQMKLQTFLLATTIACCTSTVRAQQDSVKLYQEIEQLFNITNMQDLCLQAANTSADQTITNNPLLAGRKEEARAFFIKYMGYPACKNSLLALYAKYYTKQEIDDLIKFYKTSAGKKSNEMNIRIQTESMAAMTQTLQAHASELNQLVSIQADSKAKDSTNMQ
jgi:hypothetical protein